jgi:hypothetical protein
MRRSISLFALALVACGGAAPSSLTGETDGAATVTPDSSVTPTDDGGLVDPPDATTGDDGGTTTIDAHVRLGADVPAEPGARRLPRLQLI